MRVCFVCVLCVCVNIFVCVWFVLESLLKLRKREREREDTQETCKIQLLFISHFYVFPTFSLLFTKKNSRRDILASAHPVVDTSAASKRLS